MTRTREDNPTRDFISAIGDAFFKAFVYSVAMTPFIIVANLSKKIAKFVIIGGICYGGYKYFIA